MERPIVRNGWLILENAMINISTLGQITRGADGSAMMGDGNLRGTMVSYDDVQRALVSGSVDRELIEGLADQTLNARERFAEELIAGLDTVLAGTTALGAVADYIRSKI